MRESVRQDAFRGGLAAAGYEVVKEIRHPQPGDVLLIWNRYGDFDVWAQRFEFAGADVLVVENGWLGKRWLDGEWYTLCRGHHAGAGNWKVGDAGRWDSWGMELQPWRLEGERVILGQRGIGESGIASPPDWAIRTQWRFGGRVRAHPGTRTAKPLEDDLAAAGQVLTWNSGAALKALVMGIPVHYEFPEWIGGKAAQPIRKELGPDHRSDPDRLTMFRRLAWSMWSADEMGSGVAFRHVMA